MKKLLLFVATLTLLSCSKKDELSDNQNLNEFKETFHDVRVELNYSDEDL